MARIDVPEGGKIKQRAEELRTIRDKYRDRAREYAKLTIPSLVPEVEETDSVEFQHDYNTEGAKLVNSLANTYVQTLFPAGMSHVKLIMEQEQFKAMEKQGTSKASIEEIFGLIERNHRYRFETVGSRPVMLDMMKHLIVAGNYLLYKPKDGKLMGYAIDEFMVLRSLDGQVEEVITEDKKFIATLDPEIRSQVVAEMNMDPDDVSTTVTLYTWIRRDPDNRDKWVSDQSVEGIPVGQQNSYTTESMRWIPVMWNRTRREMYGRGLVEEHYGSLWTLSILSEAMAVGCVSLADIKYLVRPGSLVNVQELNAAASGTFHYGEADDINAISTDRSRDIVMIKDVIDTYKRHLAEVFMYLPGTMRDAERVTAEENRLRAAALERAHGGVYSQLAEGVQKPYGQLLLWEMNVSGLEQDGIKLQITTGADALSRGSENDKINHWLSDLSNLGAVPPAILGTFKLNEFVKKTAAGRDVDAQAFVMNEQEQAQANQAMQDQLAQQEMGSALAKKAEPDELAAAMQQGRG